MDHGSSIHGHRTVVGTRDTVSSVVRQKQNRSVTLKKGSQNGNVGARTTVYRIRIAAPVATGHGCYHPLWYIFSRALLPLILPGSAEMIQERGVRTFLFPVCAHSAQRSHHSRRHQHIDMREQWPAFVGDERTSTRPECVWRGGITAERADNGESVPVLVAREGEDGDMHM